MATEPVTIVVATLDVSAPQSSPKAFPPVSVVVTALGSQPQHPVRDATASIKATDFTVTR